MAIFRPIVDSKDVTSFSASAFPVHAPSRSTYAPSNAPLPGTSEPPGRALAGGASASVDPARITRSARLASLGKFLFVLLAISVRSAPRIGQGAGGGSPFSAARPSVLDPELCAPVSRRVCPFVSAGLGRSQGVSAPRGGHLNGRTLRAFERFRRPAWRWPARGRPTGSRAERPPGGTRSTLAASNRSASP